MQGPVEPPPEGYAYREVPYAVKCPVCRGSGYKRTFVAFGETCDECAGAGAIIATSWETVPISVAPLPVETRPRSSLRTGCSIFLAFLIVAGLIALGFWWLHGWVDRLP